jgi:hypothetical protein
MWRRSCAGGRSIGTAIEDEAPPHFLESGDTIPVSCGGECQSQIPGPPRPWCRTARTLHPQPSLPPILPHPVYPLRSSSLILASAPHPEHLLPSFRH